MNTAKIYHDQDGNECSILQIVKREPEWAANRVQEGEKAIDVIHLFGWMDKPHGGLGDLITTCSSKEDAKKFADSLGNLYGKIRALGSDGFEVFL